MFSFSATRLFNASRHSILSAELSLEHVPLRLRSMTKVLRSQERGTKRWRETGGKAEEAGKKGGEEGLNSQKVRCRRPEGSRWGKGREEKKGLASLFPRCKRWANS